MQISVTPQGDTVFIYNEDFDASFLECTTIARASHVEPCEGEWSADMSPVGGPVLSGFTKRSQALAAEVTWLEENVL
ncbi:MAG: hypothetical protein ABSG53_16120 [Thermoguttaceae bacterium]|jgi:hypothetical protein